MTGLPCVTVVAFAVKVIVTARPATVRMKLCVALGDTPLFAVIVKGNVPPVPLLGVPDIVAVPLPLSTNVTPVGSVAPPSDSINVGPLGKPVVVTLKVPPDRLPEPIEVPLSNSVTFPVGVPDGPLTVAATLNGHVPYDWKRDFAPVSMITVGYQVLIVDPKLPVATLADFIALAKSKPGALNFASIGVGTAPHLAAELFLSVAHLKLTHVPYNGSSAQAIRAMIAGDVAMFMVGTSTAVPFIKNGNVRALAVTSSEARVDGLPDVPTFAEAGLPQVDYSLWFAILVPSGAPPEIVKKLNVDINKIVADPAYQQALKVRGFEAKGSTPGELAAFMEKDYIKNRDLIQKLGLHVD